MMEWINRIVKGFFWFAFASFLLASIPHVAYFFRAFEPLVQPGDSQNTFYWVVAYVIALSIDVMVFLLSVTVAQLQKDRAPWQTILTVYAFIVALSGLSWFINWQYAKEFSSSMLSAVTPINLDFRFFSVNVGTVDPAIASMFQVFAIAYTYIADKIATGKGKTAAELKAEADEAEERAREQVRLDDLRRQKRAARVDDAESLVGDVWERVNQARDKSGKQAEMLEKVLQFFREQPSLQADDQAALANKMLAQFVNIKPKGADLWRVRAVAILRKEEAAAVEAKAVREMKEAPERLVLAARFLADYPAATDEELAEHMHVLRPASARFWRLKLAEMTQQERDELLKKAAAKRGEESPTLGGPGVHESADQNHDMREASGNGSGKGEGNEGGRDTDAMPVLSAFPSKGARNGTGRGSLEDFEATEALGSRKLREGLLRRPTLDFNDAAICLQKTRRTVRNMVAKGTLKTAPRNKELILTSSIKQYLNLALNEVENEEQRAGQTVGSEQGLEQDTLVAIG